ncbi:hypothetical protein MKW94_014587 [Papaver nudicaule]|uniref:Thioredoxin domain-containing protein n=1 Tax=Papaver nudicaule TaxID=74823 RepID=A0AA41VBR9_PAPNU|nr:hypothetical protein [Papaver nudicaule]
MEAAQGQQKLVQSRVMRVKSEESWNYFMTQSKTEGCPVAIHFAAEWCHPSVVMNPVFEEVAKNYEDILFLMVDVDEVRAVAKKMEVKAMPTFLMMKQGGGEVVDKVVGANAEEIRKRIDYFSQSIRSSK